METWRGKYCTKAVFDIESGGQTDVNLNFSVTLLCGTDIEETKGLPKRKSLTEGPVITLGTQRAIVSRDCNENCSLNLCTEKRGKRCPQENAIISCPFRA